MRSAASPCGAVPPPVSTRGLGGGVSAPPSRLRPRRVRRVLPRRGRGCRTRPREACGGAFRRAGHGRVRAPAARTADARWLSGRSSPGTPGHAELVPVRHAGLGGPGRPRAGDGAPRAEEVQAASGAKAEAPLPVFRGSWGEESSGPERGTGEASGCSGLLAVCSGQNWPFHRATPSGELERLVACGGPRTAVGALADGSAGAAGRQLPAEARPEVEESEGTRLLDVSVYLPKDAKLWKLFGFKTFLLVLQITVLVCAFHWKR